MTNTSWLAKVLKWAFLVFTVFMGIGALAIVAVLVIDPKLPGGAHVGPVDVEVMGLTGTMMLHNSALAAQLVHGGISVRVDQAAGLVELLKHTALPLVLLNILFFMLLFDLMRRLFRNVGRGESFTRQTVRLVQIIGFSLLAFSLISAVAEGWFEYVLLDYFSHHAVLSVSGTAVHLPQPGTYKFTVDSSSPFGSSMFFTGLLVLALSEVFRQGLVLKNENDLTV
jgi:hypothetical protein